MVAKFEVEAGTAAISFPARLVVSPGGGDRTVGAVSAPARRCPPEAASKDTVRARISWVIPPASRLVVAGRSDLDYFELGEEH